MKKTLILSLAIALTGCSGLSTFGRSERSLQAEADLRAMAMADPYEVCLADKSRAQVIMMMQQEGKDPDHIYQELKPLSLTDNWILSEASGVPVYARQDMKEKAVRLFSNSIYMGCVESKEHSRQLLIKHMFPKLQK